MNSIFNPHGDHTFSCYLPTYLLAFTREDPSLTRLLSRSSSEALASLPCVWVKLLTRLPSPTYACLVFSFPASVYVPVAFNLKSCSASQANCHLSSCRAVATLSVSLRRPFYLREKPKRRRDKGHWVSLTTRIRSTAPGVYLVV